MIEIKFKTKSGGTSTLLIEELLEVDGRPYCTDDSELAQLRERVATAEGKIEAVMRSIYDRAEDHYDDDDILEKRGTE